jgi:AcrR family transcriptional regulator
MSTNRENPETQGATVRAAPRRLLPAERERMIVDGAIRFFSEHGLNGQLRDLARGLGVTHTLLYHYFPTKQALIERVYAEMFEGCWRHSWERILDDKSLDVETKLTLFYTDYAKVVLERNWVRIFIFSGMSDRYITERYFLMLQAKLFPRLVRESRAYRQLAGSPTQRSKPTARELELLMGLHGGVFYIGIRRWVYGHGGDASAAGDPMHDEQVIRDRVRGYLLSLGAVMGNAPSQKASGGSRVNKPSKDARQQRQTPPATVSTGAPPWPIH